MTDSEKIEALSLLRQLLLAFPTGRTPGPDDMKILLPVYVEAVEDFEIEPVRQTLKGLRLANPRNPFPPTPQDVYERLRSMTGSHPKKPPMQLSEWLESGTAKILGRDQAMAMWEQTLSPEAKARQATQSVIGGNSTSTLCLAAPDTDRPS